MALSTTAEEAFHAAIEAAYSMEEEIKLWGRDSNRALTAYAVYEARMQHYYELAHGTREAFWGQRCVKEPWAAGCRLYDC